MNSRRAVAQQVLALLRRVFDSEFRRSRVVIADFVELHSEPRRNARAAHGREFLDLVRVENRHDTGHDRNLNAILAQEIAEFVIIRVIEKQLREHVIRTGIDLLFQVSPVDVLALFAGDMALGKAGDADAEMVEFANEFHELVGIFKTAGRQLERSAAGRITAKRENVPNAEAADLLQQRANLLLCGRDAGEMRYRGQAVLALDAVDDFQSLIARAAAGAVSDGAKVRLGLQQGRDGFF